MVNVKQITIMPAITNLTKDKVRRYVQECIGSGRNWEDNADSICHLIENGRIISEKDIVYDEDGTVMKIRGTEIVDGILLLKEKKKPLKVTVIPDNTPIPFIEELRARRRKVIRL